MSKPFSQELYDRDDKAKHKVIDWLSRHGIDAHVNPDQYGIDLIGSGPRGKYEIEVEVKHNWSGDTFPFSTVHFSARKDKFASDNPNNFFIMLNHEQTHAMIVTGKAILNGERVTKQTIYTQAEDFIAVPANSCRITPLGV